MNYENTHQAIDGAATSANHAGEQALGAAHRGVSALRDSYIAPAKPPSPTSVKSR